MACYYPTLSRWFFCTKIVVFSGVEIITLKGLLADTYAAPEHAVQQGFIMPEKLGLIRKDKAWCLNDMEVICFHRGNFWVNHYHCWSHYCAFISARCACFGAGCSFVDWFRRDCFLAGDFPCRYDYSFNPIEKTQMESKVEIYNT